MSDYIEHKCSYCGSLQHYHAPDIEPPRHCPEYLNCWEVDDAAAVVRQGRCAYCGSPQHADTDEQPCPEYLRDVAGVKTGKKNDQGKLRWSLLPLEPVREIIRVLEFGAQKYGDHNWKTLMAEDPAAARERYYNALQRHVTAWWDGETLDEGEGGSGLHHLAHAGCCVVFLLWWDRKHGQVE